MFNNRRFLRLTVILITLLAILVFFGACAVKDGPLPTPTETDEPVAVQSPAPDINTVMLLEDAQKTNSWQVFIDDIYGLYGFKDQEGNIVIEPIFIGAEDFEGGRAIVKVKSDEHFGILEGGIYGLIDPEGEFVIDPEGLLTRVDQWHYLYAKGDDYYPAYGIDGFSMMKRTFLDGNGKALGDERFYYVEAIKEDLFLANIGSKSLFIDSEGMMLKDYPEFSFAVTSEISDDAITLVPMDDPAGRIKYVLSSNGVLLQNKSTSGSLTEGVSYKHEVISPYIGSSVIFPVMTMNDLTVQDKLNQAIQDFATEAIWETDLTGEKIGTYDELEQISQTVVNEFSLSLRNNLLNIDSFGYFYGFGAAHPNSFRFTKYLDFSTGEVLSLDMLFEEELDWRLAIVKEIDRQFMADEDAYLFIEKTETETERLESFYNAHFEISFKEDFMTVYFSVYEIAPYAAGIPTYEVSYELLNDYYDIGSDFYNALFDLN
jgi:hypothetical protein